MEDITKRVLYDIAAAIGSKETKTVKPLRCDRWLASSVLQKSIRRGQLKTAIRAATTFWHLDRVSFWRRLAIISTEDCGVAPGEVITKTLTVYNNPAWRTKTGDLNVGLYLVGLMCKEVKLRLAEEVCTIAANASEYQKLRETLVQAENPYLADYVLDAKRPLEERAIALWLLAGSKRYQYGNMPERTGSLEWAAEVLNALKAPNDLTHACISNLSKTRWPLSLFTPLLAVDMASQTRPLLVWYDKFPLSTDVEGIPLVALDGFTRTGKTAFIQFQKTVPALKQFTTKQIALAAFYTQGYCLEKRLTSERLDEMRQRGEMADMEFVGLDTPCHLALREAVLENADKLEDIRHRLIKSYLDRPQMEFFEEDE